MVEQIGNLTGSNDWKTSGQKEHAEGDAEYKAAQAKGYAEGTKDRVGGESDLSLLHTCRLDSYHTDVPVPV